MSLNALQAEIQQAVKEALAPLTKELRDLRRQLERDKPLMTCEEKAEQLRIHPDTLRRKARDGEISFKRVGNRMMFNQED